MKENIKREKFIRLAEKRTNSILNKIRLLGNLSNKSNYSYEEEEIKKIFQIIDSQLKVTKAKFHFKKDNFKL